MLGTMTSEAKMRLALLPGILIVAGTALSPAEAGMPVIEQVTCPIGGEKFEHTFTASYSTFGARPDGKPYGSWHFPMPLPTCPANGFPIYDKFTKDQIARLAPLVASAEFQALKGETPYYRAAWLMDRTGEKPQDVAWMIVQASWEADAAQTLKHRYQAQYVERVLKLTEANDKLDLLWLQARAANGLRELGRFEDSLKLINRLAPQASSALQEARKAPRADAHARESPARIAEALVQYLSRLRPVVARNDAAVEPAEFRQR